MPILFKLIFVKQKSLPLCKRYAFLVEIWAQRNDYKVGNESQETLSIIYNKVYFAGINSFDA